MSTDARDARRPISSLLLASDGSPAMEPVITVARLLSQRDRAPVHVLTAIEPLPVVSPEGDLPMAPGMEQARRQAMEAQVREQLARIAPESSGWDVRQVNGRADSVIAEGAREFRSDLVVLGLGAHGIVDRWFGGETALRVLRVSNAPVLAVGPRAAGLPTRVLVAMDFSETAERALAACLTVLGEGAKITMVHVVPREITMGVWPAWDEAYEEAVKASYADLRRRLAIPAELNAQELVLYGEPAREVLQQADRMGADLIVTGTHGRGLVAGALLGRVSTKLIRGARCSVFVSPPAPRAH